MLRACWSQCYACLTIPLLSIRLNRRHLVRSPPTPAFSFGSVRLIARILKSLPPPKSMDECRLRVDTQWAVKPRQMVRQLHVGLCSKWPPSMNARVDWSRKPTSHTTKPIHALVCNHVGRLKTIKLKRARIGHCGTPLPISHSFSRGVGNAPL